MKHTALALALAGLLCAAAVAAPSKAPAKKKTAAEILSASPASDWRALDPDNTLLMELASGQVIIELAPRFAPAHAANIRALARGGYWDGLAIVRVQDNFVTQWGDPDGDDASKARPLPAGVAARLPAEFSVPLDRIGKAAGFARLPDVDGWAPRTGFVGGFPVAANPKTGKVWLAHCYGMVGAGRDNADDSSLATELYAVIGQAPRQIDRNITVVGRVVQGIEHLSALPRGPEPMGFYEDPARRTPITAITLASDLPPEQRLRLEALRTDTRTFRDAVEARRNRVDTFYKRPAGHVDLCSVPLPVRAVPAAN